MDDVLRAGIPVMHVPLCAVSLTLQCILAADPATHEVPPGGVLCVDAPFFRVTQDPSFAIPPSHTKAAA